MRTAPGYPIIGDFSAAGLPDDGRPRVPTVSESLHLDVMDDGLAAYGLLHTRSVPETVVMRFVDLRAVYAGLSASLKAKLAHCSARHFPRATEQRPNPRGTVLPLVARHPRTAAAVLILPTPRDIRVEGLPKAEGAALLAELWSTVENSPHRFETVLRSNEVWLWDNVATVHDNPAFPRALDRAIWFLNVPGEGALAAAVDRQPSVGEDRDVAV
jgi:alpha-ketoglutarate-dependent taurine dioxygenase